MRPLPEEATFLVSKVLHPRLSRIRVVLHGVIIRLPDFIKKNSNACNYDSSDNEN